MLKHSTFHVEFKSLCIYLSKLSFLPYFTILCIIPSLSVLTCRVYMKEWQDRRDGVDEDDIMDKRYARELEVILVQSMVS